MVLFFKNLQVFQIHFLGVRALVGRGVLDTRKEINKVTNDKTNEVASFLDIFDKIRNFFLGYDDDEKNDDALDGKTYANNEENDDKDKERETDDHVDEHSDDNDEISNENNQQGNTVPYGGYTHTYTHGKFKSIKDL